MNRECWPAFETWFGDMTEASRRKQQEEVEEEKVFGTGSGGMFANNKRRLKTLDAYRFL